jgi:hypothetical protein
MRPTLKTLGVVRAYPGNWQGITQAGAGELVGGSGERSGGFMGRIPLVLLRGGAVYKPNRGESGGVVGVIGAERADYPTTAPQPEAHQPTTGTGTGTEAPSNQPTRKPSASPKCPNGHQKTMTGHLPNMA